MGGVNHCSLSCRLAKFRAFMNQVKRSPVIGWEKSHVCMVPVWISRLWEFTSQSQGCIWPGTSNHGIWPNDGV